MDPLQQAYSVQSKERDLRWLDFLTNNWAARQKMIALRDPLVQYSGSAFQSHSTKAF